MARTRPDPPSVAHSSRPIVSSGESFSDDSFRFESDPLEIESSLRFTDALGAYELQLDPRFFEPNPGNFRVDAWKLAAGTKAIIC